MYKTMFVNIKKKISNQLPRIRRISALILFLLACTLLSLLAIVIFGLSERLSIHIAFLIGLVVTILLFQLSPFSQNTKISLTRLFKESAIFLVLMELFLLIITPLHSLVPKRVLLGLHIIQNVDSLQSCNTKADVALAEHFMQTNVNLSKVEIYYGGGPQFMSTFGGPLPRTKAATYGNYIYISTAGSCINSATIVHELAHVWQYQHDQGIGPRWVPYWIGYYWTQLTNPKSLYNYGGVAGIKKALSEGKNLTSFGLEQQADILEKYYVMLNTSSFAGTSHLGRSEEFNTFYSFMNQKLDF